MQCGATPSFSQFERKRMKNTGAHVVRLKQPASGIRRYYLGTPAHSGDHDPRKIAMLKIASDI
jgi:hypothetical protein